MSFFLNRMESDPSTSTCTFDTFHGVRDHKKRRSTHMKGGVFSCEDEVNTSLMIKTNEATLKGVLHDAIEENKRLLEKLKKVGVLTPCLMAKDGSKAKSLKVKGKVKLPQDKKEEKVAPEFV